MNDFSKAVVEAMRMLARDERTVFVGQSVRYDGAAIYHSLDGVPMDAGPQHTQNYTRQFRAMCPRILVMECTGPVSVTEAYAMAHAETRSCLIVENPA